MTVRTLRLLASALLAAFSLPASAATVSFADGSFTNWTTTTYAGHPTQSTSVLGSGGNPASFLNVTTSSAGTQFTAHYNPLFSYDPSAGAITSLMYAIDRNEFFTFGQGMAYGLMLIQGGDVFLGGGAVTAGTGPNWTTHTSSVLTAADFYSSTSAHPDFSSGGGSIIFGLYTGNSGGQGITVGYDNFSATLTTQGAPSGVPDSASTGALFGLGLLALVACRRTKFFPTGTAGSGR